MSSPDSNSSARARLDAIPAKGHIPSVASSVFSCLTPADLKGFTPVARYGMLIEKRKLNADYRLPFHGKRARPLTYAVDWLLLEKDGRFFVDKIEGRAANRGYGLADNPPGLEDILLPSQVFDWFKAVRARPNTPFPEKETPQ